MKRKNQSSTEKRASREWEGKNWDGGKAYRWVRMLEGHEVVYWRFGSKIIEGRTQKDGKVGNEICGSYQMGKEGGGRFRQA